MKEHPYANTPQFQQAYRKPWVVDISDKPEPVSREKIREREHRTFVYFVQAGDDGPIKIGMASDVEKRMETLQTANPVHLRLLLKVPGGHLTEERLHGQYASHRIRGEWFEPTEALLEFIAKPEDVLVWPVVGVAA